LSDSPARTLESYFQDWEAKTFGFGYGTGEPHIIEALRMFFTLCPTREAGCRTYDYKALEHALTPTVAWLLINVLGHADVIEYGTSPRYAWLTPKGYRLREFVLSKTSDELVNIVCNHREEEFFGCGPQSCNCGPEGYEAGKLCPNPFFRDTLP